MRFGANQLHRTYRLVDSSTGTGWVSHIRIAVVICSLCTLPCSAGPVTFTVEQLTDNETSDTVPQVSGSRIVWQGSTGRSTTEVFLYDGSTTTRLTNNEVYDRNPHVSPTGVMWERGIGDATEIIFHNGTTEVPLTTNSVRDFESTYAGGLGAWIQNTGVNQDVVVWNGTTSVNVGAAAPVPDIEPHSDGANVTWRSGSTPSASIKRFDGNTVHTVDTSNFSMDHPKISGVNTAWEGFVRAGINNHEIFFNDGTTTTQITDNDYNDFWPSISGDTVVWWGGVFNDFQIYLWDASDGVTHTLSTGIRNQYPQIDGQFVVWYGYDGHDDEIFFWDGEEVHQITDNEFDDTAPMLSGNHIVWQGNAPSSLEIYHTTVVVPEPTTGALAAIAMIALCGIVCIRRCFGKLRHTIVNPYSQRLG